MKTIIATTATLTAWLIICALNYSSMIHEAQKSDGTDLAIEMVIQEHGFRHGVLGSPTAIEFVFAPIKSIAND